MLDPYAVSGKASLALFNELVATASVGVSRSRQRHLHWQPLRALMARSAQSERPFGRPIRWTAPSPGETPDRRRQRMNACWSPPARPPGSMTGYWPEAACLPPDYRRCAGEAARQCGSGPGAPPRARLQSGALIAAVLRIRRHRRAELHRCCSSSACRCRRRPESALDCEAVRRQRGGGTWCASLRVSRKRQKDDKGRRDDQGAREDERTSRRSLK